MKTLKIFGLNNSHSKTLEALTTFTTFGMIWMSPQSSIPTRTQCRSTCSTSRPTAESSSIVICTMLMAHCNNAALTEGCSWGTIITRDHLCWHVVSLWVARSLELTGLVTIGKDLKSSKQQYRCYFRRVSPVFHSVAQMCLPSQVSTQTTQS